MDDADNSCPVCKSDRYLNPNLVLKVSPCFHKMCESCINRLFLSGPAPCPICKTILKKSLFVQQTFDDLLVEKEIGIRKRAGRFFNKRLEDFNGDLKAYNDYLEEVESIMFNLIYELDVAQTQDKIEQFRQENKELIAANAAKQLTEDKAIAFKIEKEKKEKLLRKEAFRNQVIEKQKAKQKESREIIDKLASSSKSAIKNIIQEAKSKQNDLEKIQLVEDVEVDFGEEMNLAEMKMQDEILLHDDFDSFDGLFIESKPYVLMNNYADPLTLKVRNENSKLSRAGGYSTGFTYARSLSTAFANLFYNLSEDDDIMDE